MTRSSPKSSSSVCAAGETTAQRLVRSFELPTPPAAWGWHSCHETDWITGTASGHCPAVREMSDRLNVRDGKHRSLRALIGFRETLGHHRQIVSPLFDDLFQRCEREPFRQVVGDADIRIVMPHDVPAGSVRGAARHKITIQRCPQGMEIHAGVIHAIRSAIIGKALGEVRGVTQLRGLGAGVRAETGAFHQCDAAGRPAP